MHGHMENHGRCHHRTDFQDISTAGLVASYVVFYPREYRAWQMEESHED